MNVTPVNLDAIRAIEDPEDRLVAYRDYLARLDQRRATVIAERGDLIRHVRCEPALTYRRIAELTGLAEGYVRQVANGNGSTP